MGDRRLNGERRLVEAAGVEHERSAIMNWLMARDFWVNAFSDWQLPLFADFTDVLEIHRKSTRFLEGYWRRRDDAPAAGAIGCSRGLQGMWRGDIVEAAGLPPSAPPG